MIVCICKGLSDQEIEEYIKDCSSLQDFIKITGVGSDCGTCMKYIKETYKKELDQWKRSS